MAIIYFLGWFIAFVQLFSVSHMLCAYRLHNIAPFHLCYVQYVLLLFNFIIGKIHG